MPTLLVLGAASDIARAVAVKFARNGFDLYLAGRNIDELEKDAADISIRQSVNATAVQFDALDYDNHVNFYQNLNPRPDGLLFAVGYLGDQRTSQSDFAETQKVIHTNFTGVVSICNIAADDFEARKEGFVIGISSVAGDRGRTSNYIYGSAKAAITTYLSGLRGRLSRVGVEVLTVKPGFVNTRMTKDLDLPKMLVGEPEQVANEIYKAWKKKKPVVYTRWYWKYIMLIIKYIPDFIFKKMNL